MSYTEQDHARPEPWDMNAPQPGPPYRSSTGRNLALAALVIVLVFGGYLLLSSLTDAERDDSGQVTDAGTESVFDLREGDCFDEPDADEVADVTTVPCAQPHDLEVYLTFTLPMDDDAPFPDDATLESHVDDTCLPAFDTFVGQAFAESDLDVFTFEPTVESWAEGDRAVTCAVWTMDGSKLEGSVRGSGR